jgi:hypothetical protein
MQHFEHILGGQRLEIEAVGRVVIGAHRFRIAVDHDRLVARPPAAHSRVAATIIELDPLPDPVRPAAQDHDLARVGRLAFILRRAEARRLVGRVHVRRPGRELGRDRIDSLEDGADAEPVAQLAHFLLGGGADHRLQRIVDQPVAARADLVGAAANAGGKQVELGQAPVGKAHRLEPAQAIGVARNAVAGDLRLGIHDLPDPLQEPGIIFRDGMDLGDGEPFAQRLGGDEQPVRRRPGERRLDLGPRRAVERLHPIEAGQPRLEPAQRLLQAFVDRAADRHHFADRLHRGESKGSDPLNFSKAKRGILVTI